MKNVIRALVVLSALGGSLALNAQAPSTAPAPSAAQAPSTTQPPADAQNAAPAMSADELVAKHIAAIGGKETIAKIKSISMENSLQVMGNEAPNTIVILDGVGYKTETEFNGSKIVQCYTDKGGWKVNPMQGASDPTPMDAGEYNTGKDQIFVGGGLIDYAAKGSKLELLGKDTNGYKLKLTTKDNIETTFVLDPSTYLIKSVTRKGDMQGQEVEVTTSFSDYRKTDVGYLMPYTMDIDFGGQFQLSISVKKIELNKPVDPSVFAMPKSAA